MAGTVPGTATRRRAARSTPSSASRRIHRQRARRPAARRRTSTATSCLPTASSSSGRRVPRPSSPWVEDDTGGASRRRPFFLQRDMDTQHLTRTHILMPALAVALLVPAVLRPPETYAWSGAVCAILLAAAGWLAWRSADGAPRLPAWTAGLLPLAFASLLLSSCRARAFDEAGLVTTVVLAGILGKVIASDRRGREVVAGVLVALG